jgi:hypothetical protein
MWLVVMPDPKASDVLGNGVSTSWKSSAALVTAAAPVGMKLVAKAPSSTCGPAMYTLVDIVLPSPREAVAEETKKTFIEVAEALV